MKKYGRSKFFLSAGLLLISFFLIASDSFSEEVWLPEFEDICGRTDDSGSMTKDELKAVIERCDKLKPRIEQSDNPQKNVYLFRLEKCKKLFIFVLEQ